MHVVVVMPTYNEAGNIGEMIDALVERVFPAIQQVSFSILVVDDNSPDGTGGIVVTKAKQHECVILLTGERKGLGYAVCRGMRYAMKVLQADAVVEMDADFQHSPESLTDLVRAFLDGADCVVGSRYVGGGEISLRWSAARRGLSRAGSRFGYFIPGAEGLRDVTSGFRLTRVAGVLDRIDFDRIMAKGWYAYKLHLLHEVLQHTHCLVEVPILFMPRRHGRSKFSPLECFKTLEVICRLHRGFAPGQ